MRKEPYQAYLAIYATSGKEREGSACQMTAGSCLAGSKNK